MAITLLDLRKEVIRLVRSVAGAQHPAHEIPWLTDLDELINTAVRTCSIETRHYLDYATKAVPQGTTIVHMGTGVVNPNNNREWGAYEIFDAWWLDESQNEWWLRRWDYRPANYPSQTGIPRYWVPLGSRVELYPTPNANGTLRIRGLMWHWELKEETDTLSLPAYLFPSICDYAAGLVIRTVKPDQAQFLMQKALQEWRAHQQKTAWSRIRTERIPFSDVIPIR